MISVQIVDDHNLFADSFSGTINESKFAHVTGVYYSLKSCREGLAKQLPDVILLDIEMGDGDGIEFCAEITKTYPALKVIMVTGFREFNIAKHALHNGAHGYIL
ncbi:MAG: response regulator transcription factor, partial [Prevotellaceae bacterium]|nr:response regulator transcription factor [Prevotellaceae bacterium]